MTFPRTPCKYPFLEIVNQICFYKLLGLQLTLFDSKPNNRKMKCSVNVT